jgi:hypothetical protein
MTDRIARIAFFAACIVLAVTYGVYAVRWNTFPNPQIARADATVRELLAYWRNDFGFEPTRHLVAARKPRGEVEETFHMYQAGAVQPGYTMIAGLSDDPATSAHAITLYDAAGREVYRWPVDYAALDPKGRKPLNVMLHGVDPLPDGSLITAFDQGEVIARIDSCGQPMWTREGNFSHSVAPDDDGGIWSWRDETIVRLDAATGEITREIDLRRDIIAAHDLYGEFSIRATENADELEYGADPFHPNDVEPLRAAMAAAFPMFEPGDLLISLRELNMVAVIDPDDGSPKWFRHGPWYRQHDPDWEPDGTISVYDNRMGLGASRILKIDPATDDVAVAYQGNAEHPFYSYRRGKQQVLANGNVLVTESEAGRVFEAAPDGSLVWERDLGWDAQRNLIVTSADRLPTDFFQPGALACGASVEATDEPVF